MLARRLVSSWDPYEVLYPLRDPSTPLMNGKITRPNVNIHKHELHCAFQIVSVFSNNGVISWISERQRKKEHAQVEWTVSRRQLAWVMTRDRLSYVLKHKRGILTMWPPGEQIIHQIESVTCLALCYLPGHHLYTLPSDCDEEKPPHRKDGGDQSHI